MRARLSIIIPTLNSEGELPDTVASLIEGLDSGLIRELIISDGGSNDGTLAIADELGAYTVLAARGRGAQLRNGASVAKGEWLLFLHSDTRLKAGWSAVFMEHIDTETTAGYCRLKFRADGFSPWFVAQWANFRSRAFGLPYGDQGLLISRVLYDNVGGFPKIPLMEDVAIARKLRGQLALLQATALTSADKYHRGYFRRGARNLWTLLRYFWGVSPDNLARRY